MSDNTVSTVDVKISELKKIEGQMEELQAQRIKLVAELEKIRNSLNGVLDLQEKDESIDVLELSERTNKYLKADGIFSVKELRCYSRKQLLGVPNLGRKAVQEVEDALTHRNLSFKPD